MVRLKGQKGFFAEHANVACTQVEKITKTYTENVIAETDHGTMTIRSEGTATKLSNQKTLYRQQSGIELI